MSGATDVKNLGLLGSDSLAAFYVADSGATSLTGGQATTVTATVAANIDGTQPLVTKGWMNLEISGVTTHYVSTIEITIDDGTNTVEVFWFATNPDTTTTRGQNITLPILATLSDSMTTIKDVNAIITFNTGAPGTGSARLVFNGSP